MSNLICTHSNNFILDSFFSILKFLNLLAITAISAKQWLDRVFNIINSLYTDLTLVVIGFQQQEAVKILRCINFLLIKIKSNTTLKYLF